MKRLVATALIAVCLGSAPAYAVNPDEVLDDPVLEERARELSKELRCLVCRNENIDESNSDFARDMRIVLRERLAAGDTDAEARTFMVDRYGEYVLLMPPARGTNWLLYAAGPTLLLVGVGMGAAYLARRRRGTGEAELSPEEQARLEEILRG